MRNLPTHNADGQPTALYEAWTTEFWRIATAADLDPSEVDAHDLQTAFEDGLSPVDAAIEWDIDFNDEI